MQTIISVFVYEMIEEALEEAIAFGLTKACIVSINAIFAVTLTQTIKIIIKKIIKLITYKKGEDKLENLKKLKTYLLKFLRENWQTGLGIASAIYVLLEFIFGWIGEQLVVNGINQELVHTILVPMYGFIVNAMAKQGFEFGDKFKNRKLIEADDKAIKKIKIEENRLLVKAKLEEDRLLAQAEADKAKLAREQKLAEIRAKLNNKL